MGNQHKNTYELHDFIVPKILIKGIGPFEKQVKKLGKSGGSSGVIYLPKRFVGQTFKVMLIPLEEQEDSSKEFKL